MCGIVGIVSQTPVNQLVYDALQLLQHRGQDAAGIATCHNGKFAMFKANGLVRDVFRTRNMRALPGTCGIGHVRYPTAGSAKNEEEAQPLRKRPIRHHLRPQRQSDQLRTVERRNV